MWRAGGKIYQNGYKKLKLARAIMSKGEGPYLHPRSIFNFQPEIASSFPSCRSSFDRLSPSSPYSSMSACVLQGFVAAYSVLPVCVCMCVQRHSTLARGLPDWSLGDENRYLTNHLTALWYIVAPPFAASLTTPATGSSSNPSRPKLDS